MSLLFKNATVVATENNEFKVLENAYLGVEGSVISYIGADKPKKDFDCVQDMSGKILLPGFINCHGHSAMVLLRGLGSDLELQSWLNLIWPIEDRMTEEDFKNGMKLAMLEMIASGTTSFSDMYMRPAYTKSAVEESGMKANLTRVFMGGDASTDYKSYPNRIEALDFFKNYNGAFDDRLRVDFSIHAEYTTCEHLVRDFANEIRPIKGARCHIHMSETKFEHEECIRKYGKTPAAWFNDLGLFDVPTYAAHCVWVTEGDMDIMKAKGVSAVHNPESNMKLGSGFAPIPRMLEKGLNVALGTDGAASNNNLNFMEEIHMASVIHNGYNANATIMKPEQVLKMATINGAKLQGRDDTGSLEVGKKADIVAIDTRAPHMFPNFNPLALVTYSAQASDVCMTMVNGKILYKDGEFLTLDKEKILYENQKSVKRLLS
ncbi:MAG: amidohydrolase [Sphaerochaetaceae bacterium]|nr:amidohydrolase [Sphaerochaetaceae bacterium]